MSFAVVMKNPWVRAALGLLAIVGVVLLAWLLRPVLVPLFFAFIVAYILDPVVDRLERYKIRRMISIVLLAMVIVSLVALGPLLLVPKIIEEADQLVSLAQARMQDRSQGDFVYSALQRLPLRQIVEGLGWAPEGQEDYDPLAVIVSEIGERVRAGASDFLASYGSQLASWTVVAGSGVAGIFASIGRAILSVVLVVGNVVLFGVVAGYLLRDYDGIVVSARELLPQRYVDQVTRIFRKIDSQLRGFMRGQALVCLALAIIYSTGLVLSGVPFGLALGRFGGAASFVPYLGIILTAVPAGLLCIVQQGGIDIHLLGVVATFVVGQMLESTVITPRVVGEQVGLGPVWVILAVLVFGNAFGFVGLLLAVPTAATLKVLISEGIEVYRSSSLYTGARPAPAIPTAPEPDVPPAVRKKRRASSRK